MINVRSNDVVKFLDKRQQGQIMELIGQITPQRVIALYFELTDGPKLISIIPSHINSMSSYKLRIVRLVGRKQGIESEVIVAFTLFLLTNRCRLLTAFSSIIYRLMHIAATSYWRKYWILRFMHSNIRD